MSCMPDMTPTELVAVQAKVLKMVLMFLEEEKICYKMVYYTSQLR